MSNTAPVNPLREVSSNDEPPSHFLAETNGRRSFNLLISTEKNQLVLEPSSNDVENEKFDKSLNFF